MDFELSFELMHDIDEVSLLTQLHTLPPNLSFSGESSLGFSNILGSSFGSSNCFVACFTDGISFNFISASFYSASVSCLNQSSFASFNFSSKVARIDLVLDLLFTSSFLSDGMTVWTTYFTRSPFKFSFLLLSVRIFSMVAPRA